MKRGQSLIEVIVALALVSVALFGFISLSLYNYSAVRESTDRIVAYNLAREGIEVVRHLRDSNWLAGCFEPGEDDCVYWHTGLTEGDENSGVIKFESGAHGWTFEFLDKSMDECVADESCRLYDNDSVLSAENFGTASRFFRLVETEAICSNAVCEEAGCPKGMKCASEEIVGLKISAKVRWQEKEAWRNAVLAERLYNWR